MPLYLFFSLNLSIASCFSFDSLKAADASAFFLSKNLSMHSKNFCQAFLNSSEDEPFSRSSFCHKRFSLPHGLFSSTSF
jgi:hypothetical protein